jgi:hypothetical protein
MVLELQLLKNVKSIEYKSYISISYFSDSEDTLGIF